MEKEQLENSEAIQQELRLTDIAKESLFQSVKWMKFISVFGLIFCAVMGTLEFTLSSTSIDDSLYSNKTYKGPFLNQFILDFIFLAIIFTLSYFLHQYAQYLKKSLMDDDNNALEIAMEHHRRFFKYLSFAVFAIFIFFIYILFATLKK